MIAEQATVRYVEPAELQHSPCSRLSKGEEQILDDVNRRVGACESLDGILEFLANSLSEVSPCDRFSLAFIEEQGARAVSRFTYAFYDPVVLKTGYVEDIEGSSLKTVLGRRVPRVISDLSAYYAQSPHSRSTRLLLREGVASSLTCPLCVDGRVVALLFRSSRISNVYDDHQVALQLAITERLSQVIEKSYRIEQLAQANQAYFEMLGFVTHELKSPVSSMITEATLLRDGYLGELQATQRERVGKMIEKGQYLLTLVNDYLNLAQLEGNNQQQANFAEGIDLASQVLAPAIEIVRPQIQSKHMVLEENIASDLPTARIDAALIKVVLVNLISNAVKYGFPKGTIRVSADYAEEHRIAVWNEGPGFPEEQQDRLFRRFSRLNTPELMKEKGTGVGLYSCWRIIQMHAGRITARSKHGEWAEFTFTLPSHLSR